MRKIVAMMLAGAGMWTAGLVRGEEAATKPGTAVAPAMQQANGELSGENKKAREEGLKKLEGAMAEQVRSMITSDDPETQSRVAGLLQFNQGLSAWAIETLKLPEEQGKAQLDFCLRADVLPKIGGIFVQDTEKRLEGVAALAKFEEGAAGSILMRLMDDRDRPVRLAALAGLKGRKATPELVDALWSRTVEEELSMNNSPLSVKPKGGGGQNRTFDEQLVNQACGVLISLNAPEVNGKLKEVLERMADWYGKGGNGVGPPWVMDDRNPPLRSVARLLKAYKPPEAYPILLRIATGKSYQGMTMAFNDKNQIVITNAMKGRKMAAVPDDDETKKMIKTTYYWSTRTTFIKLFVEMTGQKPEDYQIKRLQNYGDMWTVPTAEDEDKAVEKIKEWWGVHEKEFSSIAATQAATQR